MRNLANQQTDRQTDMENERIREPEKDGKSVRCACHHIYTHIVFQPLKYAFAKHPNNSTAVPVPASASAPKYPI